MLGGVESARVEIRFLEGATRRQIRRGVKSLVHSTYAIPRVKTDEIKELGNIMEIKTIKWYLPMVLLAVITHGEGAKGGCVDKIWHTL